MILWRVQDRERQGNGFTLVELLVVIAIIAILASLLTPVVQDAMTKGKMTQTLSNGVQIYKVLYARHMEGDQVFPASIGTHSFRNSTDFWEHCITRDIIDADYGFFSASGLPAYSGLDHRRFGEENNAWCIVADITDGTRNVTPLLFTRNLRIQMLGDPVNHPRAVLEAGVPFGTRGVVVVNKGGSGSIQRTPLDPDRFNPAEDRNLVLRPDAPF